MEQQPILWPEGDGQAPKDCPLCPRLVGFRNENRHANPDWFNGAVPSFGPLEARLLIVGLAPGLKGANRTGRPFTGDFAGDLLYPTLIKFGLAAGVYGQSPKDGLSLTGCRITNAVRCVPPQNKPSPAEITSCRPFLKAEMASMPNLAAVLALGAIAHQSVIALFGLRQAAFPFRHGAVHPLAPNVVLADSYHCSRYNTNTGRLTESMFHDVFKNLLEQIDTADC